MWQSLGVIGSYRSLMLLPVLSSVFCILISITVLAGGAALFDISIDAVPEVPRASANTARHLTIRALDSVLGDRGDETIVATEAERKTAEHVWLVLFAFYIANYAVVAYFNVAFVHIALNRLQGGQATLNDGLKIAWDRKFIVLQWAILAATVGMILRLISDKNELGKWIAGFLGYVWKLGTYLVIPILALEEVSPGEALYRSTTLVKEVWGEAIVAGFSFPLLYFILASPGFAFYFSAGQLGVPIGVAAAAATIYWLLLAVIVFSSEQVFTAALYLYATDRRISQGFSEAKLKTAWRGLRPLSAGYSARF